MSPKEPYDEPTQVTAIDGEVVLDGPDGIGVSMTSDAAEETGRRLKAGAEVARDQLSGPSSCDNPAQPSDE